MLGSVLGGRWSDRAFARLKASNGGESNPEVRRTFLAIVTLLNQVRLGDGASCVYCH